MSEKAKKILSTTSVILGIAVIVLTFIITMVRNYDLTNRIAQTVDTISCRIEKEHQERMQMEAILTKEIQKEREERKEEITKEREARNSEFTTIQVKLAGIETTLLYIKNSIDNF